MWIKNNKKNKTEKHSGILLSCGFKQIISILLVLCLVASQAFALPNKAGLFQRMEQTSLNNSQMISLNNSNVANGEVVLSQEQVELISRTLNESSEGLITVEAEQQQQAELTQILRDTSALYVAANKDLSLKVDEQALTIAKQEGIIEELKGHKIKKTFEVGGTYNLINGWGVGADIGLKKGIVTTKIGAEALVADLLNPVKLTDLTTYTFKASIGLQW